MVVRFLDHWFGKVDLNQPILTNVPENYPKICNE